MLNEGLFEDKDQNITADDCYMKLYLQPRLAGRWVLVFILESCL